MPRVGGGPRRRIHRRDLPPAGTHAQRQRVLHRDLLLSAHRGHRGDQHMQIRAAGHLHRRVPQVLVGAHLQHPDRGVRGVRDRGDRRARGDVAGDVPGSGDQRGEELTNHGRGGFRQCRGVLVSQLQPSRRPRGRYRSRQRRSDHRPVHVPHRHLEIPAGDTAGVGNRRPDRHRPQAGAGMDQLRGRRLRYGDGLVRQLQVRSVHKRGQSGLFAAGSLQPGQHELLGELPHRGLPTTGVRGQHSLGGDRRGSRGRLAHRHRQRDRARDQRR